jgi:phosphatidate cytidylyltransferase
MSTSSASAGLADLSPRPVPDPVPESEPVSGAPGGNLALRIVSAFVLAPAAVFVAYWGGWLFVVFWAAAAIAVLWEWINLVAGPGNRLMFSSGAIAVAGLVAWRERPLMAICVVGLGALAATIFAPRERRLWIAHGIAYSGALLLAPTLLRGDERYGFFAMVLLFAVVWTTDILGFFAGRAFGGPKLAPAISPRKTWSGAIVGTLGAVIAALAVSHFFGSFQWIAIVSIALLLSVAAQLGDLLESWVKRQFGAKDASQIIPGHGGVMDLLDGFWAAALVGCAIGMARGGFDAAARGLLVW